LYGQALQAGEWLEAIKDRINLDGYTVALIVTQFTAQLREANSGILEITREDMVSVFHYNRTWPKMQSYVTIIIQAMVLI
jgi:hypothetical protein